MEIGQVAGAAGLRLRFGRLRLESPPTQESKIRGIATNATGTLQQGQGPVSGRPPVKLRHKPRSTYSSSYGGPAVDFYVDANGAQSRGEKVCRKRHETSSSTQGMHVTNSITPARSQHTKATSATRAERNVEKLGVFEPPRLLYVGGCNRTHARWRT